MDIAAVIWMTVFGIIIGGGTVAAIIYIFRFICHLVKGNSRGN